MTHTQLYQRIKIKTSNRYLEQIADVTNQLESNFKSRKPHGKAGREFRKETLKAFAFINKIAKDARSY